MTIQRIEAVQNSISGFSSQKCSLALSLLRSLFSRSLEGNSTVFSKRNLLALGFVGIGCIGVAAIAYSIFKRSLRLDLTQKTKTRDEPSQFIGSMQEPGQRSYVDKLLNEASEIAKNNFDRLMVDGDKAFNRTLFDDAEKCYAEALKAISQKNPICEAICSKKLGVVYLERAKQDAPIEDKKEDCIKAAGLLNYALQIACTQKDHKLQTKIREKRIKVEALLYSLCNAISIKGSSDNAENKQALKVIRKDIEDRLQHNFDDPKEIKELFQEITFKMKSFTASLIDKSIKVLGSPPLNCKFAVIGLGSMARNEMTPFSDLEFAILIEEGKDTDAVKQYFRNLTHLMHLKVLNLGETIVPILGIKALEGFYDETTPRGFSFDGKSSLGRGYKTPLGKKGSFELIQTPKQMAQFQGKNGSRYWYEMEPFLPTELHNVTSIYGEKGLVEKYRRCLNFSLKKKSAGNFSLRSYYAKKHLFSEDVIAFESKLELAEEGMLFELKKDLYRMPHLLIERVFLNECENLPEEERFGETFSKIDWFLEKDILCLQGADNLKWMFGKVLLARLKNSYKTNSAKSVEDPIGNLSRGIDERVCNISYIFCRAAKEYLQTRNLLYYWKGKEDAQLRLPLQFNIFYSDHPYLLAQIKMRLGIYSGVKECIGQYLELNPYDVDALLLEARVLNKLSDEKAAQIDLDKAAELVNTLGPGKGDVQVFYLLHIGALYLEIGKHLKWWQVSTRAWEISQQDHRLIVLYAFIRNDLTNFSVGLRDIKEGQKSLEGVLKELKNRRASLNPNAYSRSLACCLKNLSQIHKNQNHVAEAIKYAEESFAISCKIYGIGHPEIAGLLTYLGGLYFHEGALEKGIGYLQKGLKITTERFGELHKKSVQKYLALSNLLNCLDPSKGKVQYSYLERVEKIEALQITDYCEIGVAWMTINEKERAEKTLLKAITLAAEQAGSSGLITAYYLLAKLNNEKGNRSEALRYMELCLEESEKIFQNTPNEDLVMILLDLAAFKIFPFREIPLADQTKEKGSILSLLRRAEMMCHEIGKTANASGILSGIYRTWGYFELGVNRDLQKSMDYLAKSLEPAEGAYGPSSGRLYGTLMKIAQANLALFEGDSESLVCFERLVSLAKDGFGDSSNEYEQASKYLMQKKSQIKYRFVPSFILSLFV